jgi:hypothetical protein
MTSAFDITMLAFFISHIPITILVDSQAVFPSSFYPGWTQKMFSAYVDAFKDPLVSAAAWSIPFSPPCNALTCLTRQLNYSSPALQCNKMRDLPIWFVSLCWTEVLLQLPFFFVATYAFLCE